MSNSRATRLSHGIGLLADAAGEDAALTIALRRGGTRLTIPRRSKGTALEKMVGRVAAEAIVEALAGETIYIPHELRLVNAWLKRKGWSQERRAHRLKKSRRTIQYWDADNAPKMQAG